MKRLLALVVLVGAFILPMTAVAQTNTTIIRCVVPNLQGSTVPVATAKLRIADCRLGSVFRVNSSKPKGVIVSQGFRRGAVLVRFKRVFVVVSNGTVKKTLKAPVTKPKTATAAVAVPNPITINVTSPPVTVNIDNSNANTSTNNNDNAVDSSNSNTSNNDNAVDNVVDTATDVSVVPTTTAANTVTNTTTTTTDNIVDVTFTGTGPQDLPLFTVTGVGELCWTGAPGFDLEGIALDLVGANGLPLTSDCVALPAGVYDLSVVAPVDLAWVVSIKK
jgi:hypothetical protein